MSDGGGERRTKLIVFGVVLLVVGLIAGVGLWVGAGARLDDAVRGLARAPVGCDTTLDFSETGEFLFFVETRGEFAGVRGDCDQAGSYDVTGSEPPRVVLSMVDPDGRDVELRVRSGDAYDAAGFEGSSERVAEITTTGDHVLTVEADGSTELFVVAVGKDPEGGVDALRLGGVLAGLAGVIAGVACIVLGSRRRPLAAAPARPGADWPSAGAWPATPPGPPGAVPPDWTGVQTPPVGPPSPSWPMQPPTAPPPAPPPEQAGAWPGRSGATGPPPASPGSLGAAPAPWSDQRPPWPGRPDDGVTGDGERSPWAPPPDD